MKIEIYGHQVTVTKRGASYLGVVKKLDLKVEAKTLKSMRENVEQQISFENQFRTVDQF